jgi:hypothetical protein
MTTRPCDLRGRLLHIAELEGAQLAERLADLIDEARCGEEQKLLDSGVSTFEAFPNDLSQGTAAGLVIG